MVVFTFAQEIEDERVYLETYVYENDQQLLDKWLKPFYLDGLVDDGGNLLNEETLKEVLTGKWNNIPFPMEYGTQTFYFSVTHI